MTNENLICLLIYILSALRMYYWIRNAYSEGGFAYEDNIGVKDVLFTFMPILNTALAFVLTFFSVTGNDNRNSDWVTKFFKIKTWEDT